MKICIDAREVREVITGLGRYALNLVRHLASLDRKNEYVVLRRASYPYPLVAQDNFTEIFVPYGVSTVRNILTGRGVVNPIHADIYHCLFHLVPVGVEARRIVVTLHDLIWVEHAGISYDSRLRRLFANRVVAPFIGNSVTRADHVIAISESTRQAAIAHYELPGERFTVVHHGVDPVFSASAPPASLPEVCRGRRFVFSLGNTRPYKNIPRLVLAFSQVVSRHPDLLLVITSRGDGYQPLAKLARDLGISGSVLFTGQLNDVQVQACFADAVLFAFPSLIEGFGFPVIEAMASGCPVITSNTSSLPEIAGDAALCVDPYNVDAIASAIERLAEDEVLRRELAFKGRQRAGQFTWSVCAQKTLKVYEKVYC